MTSGRARWSRLILCLPLFCAARTGTRAQTAAATQILFDEAHHNLFASASSGYLPFVQPVKKAGFSVTTNTLPFSAQRLAMADVLTIVNPNGAEAAAPVARAL